MSIMVNYEVVSIIIFMLFLLTVALIMAKKVEFVKALLVSSLIIVIVAGVPVTGEGENIINYVIAQGATMFIKPMIIYVFSVMLANFLVKYKIKSIIEYLFMYYFFERSYLIVWFTAISSVVISASIVNLGAVMLTAILFVPILLKIGFDKQTAVSLILLTTGLGSCLNPVYYMAYSQILNIDFISIQKYYHVLAFLCTIGLIIYIGLNSYRTKLVKFDRPIKQEVNFSLLLVVLIPFAAVFILNIEMELALFLALSYGFLVAEKNFLLKNIMQIVKEALSESKNVCILLIAVGIFVNAVKTQAVIHLMAPLLITLMPQSPVQCLLFFTILSPLAMYKGPFNLQGMGAGLNVVIMSSTAISPMILGIALLSLNTIRKMLDPLDAQNIALIQYVDVDISKVIKKILPYALTINYFMLFYAILSY